MHGQANEWKCYSLTLASICFHIHRICSTFCCLGRVVDNVYHSLKSSGGLFSPLPPTVCRASHGPLIWIFELALWYETSYRKVHSISLLYCIFANLCRLRTSLVWFLQAHSQVALIGWLGHTIYKKLRNTFARVWKSKWQLPIHFTPNCKKTSATLAVVFLFFYHDEPPRLF